MIWILAYMLIGTGWLQFVKSYAREVDSLDVFLAVVWPVTFAAMVYAVVRQSFRRGGHS